MFDFYNLILSAFYNFGFWGYTLISLVALLESVVFMGVVFPGTAVIFALGFLASHDALSIKYLILSGIIGGILGDWISYYLGSRGTHYFAHDSKILKQSHIDRGEVYFKKHGGKSIFISKFIGFFRGVVAFVAGISKMRKINFALWSLVGNILSISLFALGGFFFGEFFVYFEIWSKRIGILFSIGILVAFLVWFRLKKKEEIARVKEFIRTHFNSYVRESNLWKKITDSSFSHFILKRLNPHKVSGLFATSLTLILAFHILSVTSFIDYILNSRVVLLFDRYNENFFVLNRTPILTDIFRWITLIFDFKVYIVAVLVLGIVLFLLKEKLYMFSLWVFSFFTLGSIYLLKFFIDRGRPLVEPLMLSGEDASFPSGHAAAALFLIGFMYYIGLKENLIKRKILSCIAVVISIVLVGVSRIYLGLHFASDVLAGFMTGLLWHLLMISTLTLIQKRFKFLKEENHISTYRNTMFAFALIIISLFGFLYYGNNKIKEAEEYINGEEFQTIPRFVENN